MLAPWVMAMGIYIVLFYFLWFRPRHRRCKHPLVFCLHGDEIRFAGGHRSQCIVCSKTFPGLPEVCMYTGEKHSSWAREDDHGY